MTTKENYPSNPMLASTAHWTASARARETRRQDRLFNDPFAEALAGEGGAAWIAQHPEDSTIPMVIRTRFFDDFLQKVCADHGIRQVVILAAGLDTRAYRLRWPEGTHLYELDQLEVLEYKKEILFSCGAHPACRLHSIGVDLTGAWTEALLEAGFEPRKPSAMLLEGFLFYLPTETIGDLIDKVSGMAVQGSWLGFDIVNSVVLTSPWTKAWVDMQAEWGAPWIGTLDAPDRFLSSRGWEATLTQPGEPNANYGRWKLPVIPSGMPDMPRSWYVTARRVG